jgi:hypothetical protein
VGLNWEVTFTSFPFVESCADAAMPIVKTIANKMEYFIDDVLMNFKNLIR